ncbi:hypothetical protein CANCADRAFT_56759 [Tortispora caseinolytica NRRL Y-17796]|uniref:Uncharacterized protein n=1 Tax=Tortispora caseinolytica NRRL Y-17796 TaxID=767744 RepID=A0A1E4TEU9_9ASCO|nr:hypothetical protein CANCADRAFT_56759 [Tortispora caseinolytica NRRL Y-17796]
MLALLLATLCAAGLFYVDFAHRKKSSNNLTTSPRNKDLSGLQRNAQSKTIFCKSKISTAPLRDSSLSSLEAYKLPALTDADTNSSSSDASSLLKSSSMHCENEEIIDRLLHKKVPSEIMRFAIPPAALKTKQHKCEPIFQIQQVAGKTVTPILAGYGRNQPGLCIAQINEDHSNKKRSVIASVKLIDDYSSKLTFFPAGKNAPLKKCQSYTDDTWSISSSEEDGFHNKYWKVTLSADHSSALVTDENGDVVCKWETCHTATQTYTVGTIPKSTTKFIIEKSTIYIYTHKSSKLHRKITRGMRVLDGILISWLAFKAKEPVSAVKDSSDIARITTDLLSPQSGKTKYKVAKGPLKAAKHVLRKASLSG